MHDAVLALALFTAVANPTTLDCRNPVPPTDFDVNGRPLACEQQTVSDALSVPLEQLKRRARDGLVARLCKLEPVQCASLAAKIKEGPTGTAPGEQCAQAVVCEQDLEAWRRTLAPNLDAELKATAARLSSGARLVVVRGIEDNGTNGGPRATWLLNRMQAALSSAGVQVVDPPKSWNGARPVAPAERLLRCEVVDVVDPVKQLPFVEATWKSSADGIAWTAEPPLRFPAVLAPAPPRRTGTVVERGDDVVLHVATRDDGSLCDGDRTQLRLTNRGSTALHMRVLNIDAQGHVLVLFPNDQRPDGRVAAGRTLALADDDFEVDGHAGDRERYVVLAAPDVAGLGRFGRVKNTDVPACRLSAAEARRVAAGDGLDAAQIAETGFTIVDDGACHQRPTPPGIAADVDQLPVCP